MRTAIQPHTRGRQATRLTGVLYVYTLMRNWGHATLTIGAFGKQTMMFIQEGMFVPTSAFAVPCCNKDNNFSGFFQRHCLWNESTAQPHSYMGHALAQFVLGGKTLVFPYQLWLTGKKGNASADR